MSSKLRFLAFVVGDPLLGCIISMLSQRHVMSPDNSREPLTEICCCRLTATLRGLDRNGSMLVDGFEDMRIRATILRASTDVTAKQQYGWPEAVDRSFLSVASKAWRCVDPASPAIDMSRASCILMSTESPESEVLLFIGSMPSIPSATLMSL